MRPKPRQIHLRSYGLTLAHLCNGAGMMGLVLSSNTTRLDVDYWLAGWRPFPPPTGVLAQLNSMSKSSARVFGVNAGCTSYVSYVRAGEQ
eukprot:6934611-Pyramimonas_sp.AAC.1